MKEKTLPMIVALWGARLIIRLSRMERMLVASFIGVLISIYPAFSQGTFQNLDFERANIISIGGEFIPELVSAPDALPGWTVYSDGNSTTFLIYNTLYLSSTLVSIHDSSSPVLPPLGGRYFVAIQHFVPAPGGLNETAGIGQTGQIPADMASLVFWAANYQNLEVTFNGAGIPLVEVGTRPGYSILAGDIRSYAGQTGELRFTQLGGPNYGVVTLDNIRFSAVAVPEPSTLALLAGGGLLLFAGSNRRRKWHKV